MEHEGARRPLKSRSANWPRQIAFALVRKGFTPNQISVASLVFSLLGAICLLLVARQESRTIAVLLFIATAICIQLRLVCNLLDGLMAVEGGKKTKTGEIFNEFPDRVADVVLFVCAGYCVSYLPWAVSLGWACAVGAVAHRLRSSVRRLRRFAAGFLRSDGETAAHGSVNRCVHFVRRRNSPGVAVAHFVCGFVRRFRRHAHHRGETHHPHRKPVEPAMI